MNITIKKDVHIQLYFKIYSDTKNNNINTRIILIYFYNNFNKFIYKINLIYFTKV